MALSRNEELIIKGLIKIDKRLFDLLRRLALDYKPEYIMPVLKSIIEKETELIDSIKINEKKYKEALDMMNMVGPSGNSNTLFSSAMHLNDSYYSRLRIAGRLYYSLLNTKTVSPEDNSLKTLVVDEQVSILYNLLMRESKEEKNKDISRELTLLALISLMDSRNVEKEFLERPFGVDLTMNDTLRLATDVMAFNQIKFIKDVIKKQLLFCKEPYGQVQEKVLGECNEDVLTFILVSLVGASKKDEGYEKKLNITYYEAYLKALIACYPPDIRKQIYEYIIIFTDKNFNDINKYKTRINDLISDIEHNIVPRIIKYRIHREEMPQRLFY